MSSHGEERTLAVTAKRMRDLEQIDVTVTRKTDGPLPPSPWGTVDLVLDNTFVGSMPIEKRVGANQIRHFPLHLTVSVLGCIDCLMRPYSLDLRERIVAALHDEQTEKQVAARFGVSESSVTRYDRLHREAGSLCTKTPPGRKSLPPLAKEPAFRELLTTREDWTLATLAPA